MDKKKIQEGVKLILEGIGENPDREGLIDTPDRIAFFSLNEDIPVSGVV